VSIRPVITCRPVSTVFVAKSDRWLSALTLHLSTHHSRLSSLTYSSLPSATRDYISPLGHTDPDHLVEVAEWCLIIIAWGCGIPNPSSLLSPRTLDRVSFALFLDHELGETLERWRVACEEFVRMRTN
jgi:hypothetical protein